MRYNPGCTDAATSVEKVPARFAPLDDGNEPKNDGKPGAGDPRGRRRTPHQTSIRFDKNPEREGAT
jgi:hypothetical protein